MHVKALFELSNMKPVPNCKDMVKSGNFGHQVNSDIHLQTVEILMRRLLMSRLIRIFTVSFVDTFLYSNN